MKRPAIHFTPKENWMNDPNGLVYFKGEYHLFYQHNPNALVWGPMHWGHAISKDLLTWDHYPIALYPDEIGTIYSGCCVVDLNDSSGFFDGNPGLVAVFTHHKEEEEVQSLAYSKDNGRTWIKYSNNPVIKNPGKKDFRDPKVFWHDETQKWIVVFAFTDRVRFYSSTNLREWEFISEFGETNSCHDGMWECPELLKLFVDGDSKSTKWVLKVDVWNSIAGGSGGKYYIGEFDGKLFKNENPKDTLLWIDYSKDFYASQSWFGLEENHNRQVWIGWMNNWQYANEIPARDYRGMMSIPRELALINTEAGLRLSQMPIREIDNHREILLAKKDFNIKDTFSIDIPEKSRATEIYVEICEEYIKDFLIKLYYGQKDFVVIGYSTLEESLYIDRNRAGKVDFNEKFAGLFKAPLKVERQKIKLQIIADVNSIEIFANNGTVTLSSLIFPLENLSKIEFTEQLIVSVINIFNLV